MAGTFTSTGSYSNLTRLELEQLRKADFYAGLKALTVGDSALPPEGVVGPGSINAEPYFSGPTISLTDVLSITPPAQPGLVLGFETQVAQPSTGMSGGVFDSPSSVILSSTTGTLYGPQSVFASVTGTTPFYDPTGTCVVTNGSTNVPYTITVPASLSLVGTFAPGVSISFSSQSGVWYKILSVSDTAITLAAPYAGTGSGSATMSSYIWTDTTLTFVEYPAGTFGVSNGTSTVLTSSNLTSVVNPNDTIMFGEQPGVYYKVSTVLTTQINLLTAYTGTSNTLSNAVVYPNTVASNSMARLGDVLFVYGQGLNPYAVGTVAAFGAANSVFLSDVNGGASPTGTFGVTNGSTNVTTSLDQTSIIPINSQVVFGSQPNVAYLVNAVTSSTLTLNTAYAGTSSGSTSATSANFQFNLSTGTVYGIIRPNAVQLFAVPGSGPTGSEQTFMAVIPTSTLHNNTAPTVNQINTDRVKNIIPSQYALDTTVDRADAWFDSPAPRQPLTKLGYRVVLYPDNGSGAPNMAAPIATLTPVIDPAIPSTDQRFTVDTKAGIVRFSCAPKIGGQIKVAGGVNGTTGRLNLYAVFWAYPEPGTSVSTIPSGDGGPTAGTATSLYAYSPETGYSFQTLTQIQTAYRKMARLYSDSTAAGNWDSVLTAGSGAFSGTGNFFNWVFSPVFGVWIGSFKTGTPTWGAVSTADNGRTVASVATIGSHTMEQLWGFGAEPTAGYMIAASAGSGGYGITTSNGNVFYQIDRFDNNSVANTPTLNLPSSLVWFPFNSNFFTPSWVAVTGGTHFGSPSPFNAALMINPHNTGNPSSGSNIVATTFHTINGSTAVTASASITGLIVAGSTISFSNDERYYTVAAAAGTSITLVGQYLGSTATTATGRLGFWQDLTSSLPGYWQNEVSAGNNNVGQLITCQSSASADAKGPRMLIGRCVTTPSTGSSFLLMMDGGATVTDVSPTVLVNKALTGIAYSGQDNLWGMTAQDNSGNLYFYISTDISVPTLWTQVTVYPNQNLTGSLAVMGSVWLLQYSDTFGTNRVLYSGDVSKFTFQPGNAGVTLNSATVATQYDLSYALPPGTTIQFLTQVGTNYVVKSATATQITLTFPFTGSTNNTIIFQPVLFSTPNGNPGSATSSIVSNGSAAVAWSTGNVEFSKQSGFPGGF